MASPSRRSRRNSRCGYWTVAGKGRADLRTREPVALLRRRQRARHLASARRPGCCGSRSCAKGGPGCGGSSDSAKGQAGALCSAARLGALHRGDQNSISTSPRRVTASPSRKRIASIRPDTSGAAPPAFTFNTSEPTAPTSSTHARPRCAFYHTGPPCRATTRSAQWPSPAAPFARPRPFAPTGPPRAYRTPAACACAAHPRQGQPADSLYQA